MNILVLFLAITLQLAVTAYAREPDNENNLYPSVFVSVNLSFRIQKSYTSNPVWTWPYRRRWYEELHSNIYNLWLSQDPAQYQYYLLDSEWEQYVLQIASRLHFHRVFIEDCNPGKQFFDGKTFVDLFRGSKLR